MAYTGDPVLREYVYLNGMPLAMVARRQPDPPDTQSPGGLLQWLLEQLGLVQPEPPPEPEIFYFHTDHLGTPLLLMDADGNVAWQGQYRPFGEVAATTEDVVNPLRFPGQHDDGASGVYYNYFRDYDPAIGRYIQSDPIGLGGGINTYTYVKGNPIFWGDPVGLDATVCLYSGASGFGHVGIGVNSNSTQGFYPKNNGFDALIGTLGKVKSDTGYPKSCKTISTSPAQDKQISNFIKGASTPPLNDYTFFSNNCVNFVRNALRAAGVNSPETIAPKPFFENLPGAPGDSGP